MFTCPLTPHQKRLWVEWKLCPDGHYYNINAQFKISGSLDHVRFREALRTATGCFEAFRTYFAEQNGQPHQVILGQAADILSFIDLAVSERRSQDTEAAAVQLLNARAKEPIDLTSYPLMRAYLVRIAPETHYFMLINAHILSDGYSAKMIFEALSAVYNGDASAFAKYARHANASVTEYLAYLKNHYSESDETDYWANTLEHAPLRVELASAPPKTRAGKRHYFTLEGCNFQNLKALARKEKTTVFNVLAAAYAAFLHRRFGANDMILTYPVNVRGADFSHTFGFYVNNVPLRVRCDGRQNFQELVAQVTAQRRQDREYEHCAIDEINRLLRRKGVKLPEAPFNIGFGQTSLSLNSLTLDGTQVEALCCDPDESLSDLSLLYDATADTIGFYWEYKTELFSESEIRYLTESFLTLLCHALASTDLSVAGLHLLSSQQQADLIHACAGSMKLSENPSLYDYSMVAPLSQYAVTTPDMVALEVANARLTYRELDIKTNRLAHYLRGLGVRRHDRVAVCMERSETLIVALIGILKAGAAYVPIDPHYPEERIKNIVADSQPKAVLCTRQTSDVTSQLAVPHYCLDGEIHNAAIDSCANTPPTIAFDSEDTAYVIYTSGSSGAPKGVMVSHANVNARLHWLQDTIELTSADRALQTINYCFDPSVFEIFWPLQAGATLVLPKPGISRDPQALVEILEQERITFFSTIPSLLKLLLQKLKPGELLVLRAALCGGEVLPRALANVFLERTGARLFNAYGPTETTILATCHECSIEQTDAPLPIGCPLYDTSVYILDANLQLLPPGAVGELCIAGAGVAKGYLGQRVLSVEKFIADPFSGNPDAKLYRTGDLGRYLPDGTIEFIGRADTQLKVRGFRIEPGEIEHALTQIPDVLQAAVVAQKIPDGHRLVGYYSPANLPSEEVRRMLAKQLPEHMLPAFLVALEAMPITTNGKIDRAALPEPNQLQLAIPKERPTTALEALLLGIFAEVLQTIPQQISVDSTFFDSGGDSLQAIELALLINRTLGLELPDTILFEHPSVAALARHLAARSTRIAQPAENTLTLRAANRNQMREARRKLQQVG